jgi:hypothetical protein
MAPALPAVKLEREKKLKSILSGCSPGPSTIVTYASQLSGQISPNDSKRIEMLLL